MTSESDAHLPNNASHSRQNRQSVIWPTFLVAEFTTLKNGGDEPVFFIIAIVVCPIGFLVGAVGSIVLAIRRHRMAR